MPSKLVLTTSLFSSRLVVRVYILGDLLLKKPPWAVRYCLSEIFGVFSNIPVVMVLDTIGCRFLRTSDYCDDWKSLRTMLIGPLVWERLVPLLVIPYEITLSPFLIQLRPAFFALLLFGNCTLFLTLTFILLIASCIFRDIGLSFFIDNLERFWAAMY